jgi:undecaprenyl-diphosphatase
VSALDLAVRAWIVHHRVDPLNPVMLGLTRIGAGGLVWVIMALILVAVRRATWRELLRVMLTMALTTIVADYVVKPIVHRPRPFLVLTDAPVIGHAPHDSSFPSGHAADAVAGALTLSRASPTGRIAWWLLAASIAYSRIYLGVHYPSDIAASIVIGLVCAALVLTAADRVRPRRDQVP